MRRIMTLLTASFVAIALASCGDSSDDEATGELPAVTGAFGEKPTITAPEGDPGGELVTEVLSPGDGAELAAGNVVIVNYLGQIWRDNATFANSYDSGSPVSFTLDKNVIAGFTEGLVGKTVGSRVLLVVPPDKGFGAQGLPDAGLTAEDTLVFVVDLVDTFPPQLSGEPSATGAKNLPTVEGAADAKPAISIPQDAEPPTKTVVQPIISGDGEPVTAGGFVVVKYVGVKWSDGKQFDASWDQPSPIVSFTLSEDQLIKGWVEGLEGVPVGSRVLMVIPPASGYGETGTPDGSIKGNETLVFVVDLLGSSRPASG